MELIETVAENSHHNATKPFGRGAMLKGQIIDDKSAEMGMLLKRIEKMAEVQNLLLDRVNIRKGSEGLAPVSLQEVSLCPNCSRFDHIELDCPVMTIQGQSMFRQGPSGGPTQQRRPNYPGTYPNYYNTPIFNNPSQNAGFRRNNDQPYSPPYNGDGELSQNMNTRVPIEPRYNLRKRSQSQQQQDTIVLLIHQFERLSID